MATLQELLAQRAELEKQIAETRTKDRSEAIEKVRQLMRDNGLTLADISGRAPAPARTKPATGSGTGSKVAAKYRNASTGETWSGRGLQPRWLKAALASGKTLDDFAV